MDYVLLQAERLCLCCTRVTREVNTTNSRWRRIVTFQLLLKHYRQTVSRVNISQSEIHHSISAKSSNLSKYTPNSSILLYVYRIAIASKYMSNSSIYINMYCKYKSGGICKSPMSLFARENM